MPKYSEEQKEKIKNTQLYKHFEKILDFKGYVEIISSLFTEEGLKANSLPDDRYKIKDILEIQRNDSSCYKDVIAKTLQEDNKLEKMDDILYYDSKIHLVRINSLNELLGVIELKGGKGKEIKTKLTGESVYYRGQNNINYEPIPTLLRNEKYLEHEKEIKKEMIIKNPEDFIEDKTEFDKLVRMQHYGAPTRLLDITFNPLIALYFACMGDNKNSGEILFYDSKGKEYYYDDEDIAELLADKNTEELKKGAEIRFVHAKLNNRRIINQQGLFLLFLNKLKPEEMASYFKITGKKQIVFFIPNNKKSDILKTLSEINIREDVLFPEIDKVAKQLKRKYNEDLK